MKTISLEIDNAVYEQTEKILINENIPRNMYINEALIYYNSRMYKRKMLGDILKKASRDCEKSSGEVLKEFEMIEDYDF